MGLKNSLLGESFLFDEVIDYSLILLCHWSNLLFPDMP